MERMTGAHRDAIERVVTKLHEPPCPNKSKEIKGKTIGDILYMFWLEFKDFQRKKGIFDKEAIWLTNTALLGKSHVWHELYSLPYMGVLGFIACSVCSEPFGNGPYERIGGYGKNIKAGKRSKVGGWLTKKRSVLYNTANIHDARINRNITENIDAEGPNRMFGDDDIK